ncbi:MAG: hypothetical protein RLZZ324_581, partial [Candidatus Parcubacteria bacterium]
MRSTSLNHSVFPAFLTAAALFGLAAPLPAWAGGAILAGWVLGMGFLLGGALLPREHAVWRVFFGSLSLTAVTVCVGAVIYKVWRLDTMACVLVLVLSAVLCSVWMRMLSTRGAPLRSGAPHAELGADPAVERPDEHWSRTGLGIIAVTAALALTWAAVTMLASSGTADSIRSPWDAVPSQIFALFFIAAALTLTAALGGLAPRLALVSTAALTGMLASVTALVYKVGYGFDPFLHRAAEQTIFTQGFISPKPFYYLGQYAIVTLTARFLKGGVPVIDATLVPVALALVVPCAYYALRRGLRFSRAAASAAAALVLLLPLSAFAATTPQGFADALFLMTALLAIPAGLGAFPLSALFALACASAATHPLAGVPLLFFVALVASFRAREGAVRGAVGRVLALPLMPFALALAGAAALPAMFVVNAMLSGAGGASVSVGDTGVTLADMLSALAPTRRFHLFLDFTYAWNLMRVPALLALAMIGARALRKKTHAWTAWLLGTCMLAANWLLMNSWIRLPFLISYEQSSYADRVFELGLFLLAPLALAGAASIFRRITAADAAVK